MSGRAIKAEQTFNPPASFPDPATCRVKAAGFGDYMDCLSKWGLHCPFSLPFGGDCLCQHPLKRQILAQSGNEGPGRVEFVAGEFDPSCGGTVKS